MTIKYNVSGAKARNGKEITPMAFGDRAEAERFAKYHEGLSVPQNLRKHPGTVQAFSNDRKDFEPTAEQTKAAEEFFARPVESLALQHQEVGRLTRIQDIVTITTRAQPATVGNSNADLEEAYAMGYRLAVANSFWTGCTDEDVETQDYVDQRRSDLKELVSYDRKV